ncbi:MAG TPA: asparagine synthase (glutamine-hydrolyzing), partial [Flavisolibacter sp.]|nr:asparagine synthase (glutamine-hydrolyzing) [Flavisolibacter sp.]
GEGFHVHKNLALGHRRLAIIDLSTGEQPMYSEDNTIVLVFNGEIYNYIELREELVQLGYTFTTTSDTEVIIKAYRTWGVDCQSRFNGMWAFALWDEAQQRLFVSRDRIGEKPLYYAVHDQTFVFGSEIKSVLAYGVPKQPRLEMTELYLTMSFIPAPYAFYQHVSQLMAGKYLLVDGNGIKERTYWDLPDITEKDLTKDKERVEKEFAHLFNDSVRIRMRSDVEFGAFLSGGLDSSCVVSAMAQHTAKPIQTFTMGFENKQYDERFLAQLVADRYHTDHHVGIVSSEHFDAALEKVLQQYDEPFGDASAIPTGHISKYAAEYVKMVLTGDGGDEVLSGYTTFQGEKFAKQYQQMPAFVRRALPVLAGLSAKPLRGNLRYKLNRVSKVLQSSNLPFEERLLTKLAHTAPENIEAIIQPGLKTISFFDYYNEAMKGCRFSDPFYKLVYFQHKVTLPGDMLTKVDRMSMAYSIETRIPFLDYRIIELLYGVDKSVKTKGYINKIILRNAVANDALPKELLDARKKGFTVPLRDWFREDSLDLKIRKMLLSQQNGVFNAVGIEKLIEQNRKGEFDLGNFIWMVLVLKSWMDKSKQSREVPAAA